MPPLRGNTNLDASPVVVRKRWHFPTATSFKTYSSLCISYAKVLAPQSLKILAGHIQHMYGTFVALGDDGEAVIVPLVGQVGGQSDLVAFAACGQRQT